MSNLSPRHSPFARAIPTQAQLDADKIKADAEVVAEKAKVDAVKNQWSGVEAEIVEEWGFTPWHCAPETG